jgi:hypothetical protein
MAYKRKQYIVDKKFQLGTTFSVIGASVLIVALIIAAITYSALHNNTKLADIEAAQDQSVQMLSEYAQSMEKKARQVKEVKPREDKAIKPVKGVKKEKQQVAAAADDLPIPDVAENNPGDQDIAQLNKDHMKNRDAMNEMIRYNKYLLWAIVILLIAQGVVLFTLLILKTHRIAGPIYVMSMYMRQIVKGTIPTAMRPLRQNDELKDFYNLFQQVVEKMKKGKSASSPVKKAVKVNKKR